MKERKEKIVQGENDKGKKTRRRKMKGIQNKKKVQKMRRINKRREETKKR